MLKAIMGKGLIRIIRVIIILILWLCTSGKSTIKVNSVFNNKKYFAENLVVLKKTCIFASSFFSG